VTAAIGASAPSHPSVGLCALLMLAAVGAGGAANPRRRHHAVGRQEIGRGSLHEQHTMHIHDSHL